ncbi:porin [Ignatzschineria indica]|uniref:Porin domain-containing protein n=1 Tax=Ignatzschineria indica TaxID=472583 RepID=A0A2U2AJA2_9GAMM|nr:porin [Ignatzschineria indica]PWD82732.1 hypothetical protein DC082_08975 [Ignatzschineria indica]GGZ86398.1 porin [Ignatzschineria indica]
MMKKSIFAVAVASVLTLGAAQAETVLYGSIRYDYESKKVQPMKSVHEEEGNAVTKRVKRLTSNRVSNLNDAGSRIGLKGSEDLGNNNAVIYNLEWGFDGMVQDESNDSKWTTRKAILGLTGDWGTVTAGRQDNPFKVTIVDDSVTDEFNGGNVISSAAQRAMTTSLLAQGLSGEKLNDKGKLVEGSFVNTVDSAKFSRVGKVIAYTTPNFEGFQANAAVMMDDNLYPTNNRKNADLWTVNAQYAYDVTADGQILAKLGYIQGKVAGAPSEGSKKDGIIVPNNNGRYSSKIWGLFLGYVSDELRVTAAYADGTHKVQDVANADYQNGQKQKSKGWDLGASYSFGPNYFSTVRAAYGENHVKVAGEKDKVKSWAVGFEQKLSTRTRAWVEYGATETKFAGNNSDKQKDNVVSIGMRHDF